MRSDISIATKNDHPSSALDNSSLRSHGSLLPPAPARISSPTAKHQLRPGPLLLPPHPHGKLRKMRNRTPERAHEALSAARTADCVHLFLRDGRVIEGAILFNEYKGTGRIINIDHEISVDFRTEDVRDIRAIETKNGEVHAEA